VASNLTVGFLGAGKMATALAKGFVRAGLVKPEQILASDPSEPAAAHFAKEVGARTTAFNPDVARFAKVLILAVKPDQVSPVLREIREEFTDKHLLLSIAAGITLARLEEGLGTGARLIRLMPNTPALLGQSATAFALGKAAAKEDAELAQKLFSSVGVAVQLKE